MTACAAGEGAAPSLREGFAAVGPVQLGCIPPCRSPRAHRFAALARGVQRSGAVATFNQQPSTSNGNSALDRLPTTELMRQVLDETKELVRIEARLAREELSADLLQLKSAAILGGVAAVLALLTLATLVLSLVLALGGVALTALIAAAVLLIGASVTAWLAYRKVPKPPLARTRDRLKSDVTQLKEHIQ